MCHTWMWPIAVSTARTTHCSSASACVTSSSRCFGMRSTNTLANNEPQVMGRNCNAATVPRATGEWVISSTSQAWPIFCIQAPICETSRNCAVRR